MSVFNEINRKYVQSANPVSIPLLEQHSAHIAEVNKWIDNGEIDDPAEAAHSLSHAFDKMLHDILKIICESSYTSFKRTESHREGLKSVKSFYNQVDVNDFEYYEILGEGTFGFVVHCKKKTTGMHYAMKIQTKIGLLRTYRKDKTKVTSERDILAAMRHPFIISMDYAMQTESLTCVLMDLGTGNYK